MRGDNIIPWSEYARDEWKRMEASWTAPAPLEPWTWTCGTCGAEMTRDAIPGHDHDAPTGGAIVWLLAAVVVALFVVVIVRWPR